MLLDTKIKNINATTNLISVPFRPRCQRLRFSNLAPLQCDTISFSSRKTRSKKLNLNDPVLDSIKDITKKYEAYIVGGYMRDYFNGKQSAHDWDLVCKKNAKQMAQEIAKTKNGTLITLNEENKIYRVVLNDKATSFDIAEAKDNDVFQDIYRRDLTINSIFYNLNTNEVIDPLNGIDDVQNKIIRTSSMQNMLDDPLRMLRVYRFMAKTGFKIDEELENFCKSNFSLINGVAPERITQEVLNIFSGKYCAETLEKMYDDGVLKVIFPFVEQMEQIPSNQYHKYDLIHHSIETVNNISPDKPLLRLAAFCHDIGKIKTWSIDNNGNHHFYNHESVGSDIIQDELKKIKLSNKQINYIKKIIKYHMQPLFIVNTSNNEKSYLKFLRTVGEDSEDVIELSKADFLASQGLKINKEEKEQKIKKYDRMLEYCKKNSINKNRVTPLLNGNEIMTILHIKPSRIVGEITNKLKEAQLNGAVNSKEDAIEFVVKYN